MTHDTMTIRRIANGWLLQPGGQLNEFTHIAATPAALAAHVAAWAEAQIAEMYKSGGDPEIKPRLPPDRN